MLLFKTVRWKSAAAQKCSEIFGSDHVKFSGLKISEKKPHLAAYFEYQLFSCFMHGKFKVLRNEGKYFIFVYYVKKFIFYLSTLILQVTASFRSNDFWACQTGLKKARKRPKWQKTAISLVTTQSEISLSRSENTKNSWCKKKTLRWLCTDKL